MALALGALILGRWAHSKPALNTGTVAGGAFAIIVIAALDGGETEGIAQGLAWIFLAVVLLSADSPLSAIAKLSTSTSTGKKAA